MEQQNKIVYAHRINITQIVDNMKIDKPTNQKEKEKLINTLAEFINKKFNPHVKIKRLGIMIFCFGIVGIVLQRFFSADSENHLLVSCGVSFLGAVIFIIGAIRYSNEVGCIATMLAKIRDEGLSAESWKF